MQAFDHLTKLSQSFSPSDSALVVLALRQDPLIWRALEDPGFASRALGRQNQSFADWSPAALALLVLNSPEKPEAFCREPMLALGEELQRKALHACDELFTTGSIAATLENAGLIALALRERYRVSPAWEDLFDLSSLHLGLSKTNAAAAWRASLACLYGLIPNPRALLKALVNGPAASLSIEWATHCMLCSPSPVMEQVKLAADVLLDTAPEKQLAFLKQLELKGLTTLAETLAQTLVNAGQQSFAGLWDREGIEEIHPRDASGRAARLQEIATLYQHAGYAAQARSLLDTAVDLLQHAVASIQAQAMGFMDGEVSTKVGMAQEQEPPDRRALLKLAPASSRLQTDLLLGAARWKTTQAVSDLLPADSRNPLVAIFRASTMKKADRAQAQDQARQAVPRLMAELNEPSPLWARSAFAFDPTAVLDELQGLDLNEEAVRCAEKMLEARPADLVLIAKTRQVCQKAGASRKELDLASLAVLLAPEDVAQRRALADALDHCDEWSGALDQREQLVKMVSQPTTEDWLSLARSAYRCNKDGRSMEVCIQLLAGDEENGGAHALTGQILLKKGQKDEAARHLSRATLLAPEDPEPWLHLALIQQDGGEPQRGLETLRAAVLAVPGSADLHFALAKACLENSLPSEALPFLQEAARLNPESAEIAWKLGATFRALGHSSQAQRTFEAARGKWPQHPLVAVADAEMQIEAGNQEAAIPGLEVALQSENPEPEWYLLYARALLNFHPDQLLTDGDLPDPARLAKAQLALQKLLVLQPGRFEGEVLFAETQHAQKSLQAAFEKYRALVDCPEAAQPEWRWRVQAGFGEVALAIEEVETAVAALREAAQARPEDLVLHQRLAEAYRRARLDQEAAQAARQALQLSPGAVDSLAWFIDFLTSLGLEQETLDALTAATQLAPERPGFWNRLARLKLQLGDTEGARQALSALTGLSSLTSSELQEAACAYLRLEDRLAALACLEQAAAAVPETGVFIRISGLRYQCGQVEEALEAIQTAEELSPQDARLHVFHADLLAQLKRPQAALACLERAQRLIDSRPETAPASITAGWMPAGWGEAQLTPGGIATRFALLLRDSGSIQAALHHAEKALDEDPGNYAVRYLAADLSRTMLNRSKAAEQAEVVEQAGKVEPEEKPWVDALYALRAELALETGDAAAAASLVEQGLSTMPAETRYLALQARLLQRSGDHRAATAAFETAVKSLPTATPAASASIQYPAVFGGCSKLYLAEAALDLERWNDALRGFESYAAENPHEARALVRHARALVLAAEKQRLCQMVKSTAHAPGANVLSQEFADRFEKAIQAAGHLCNSVDVITWQARGRAAFHPSLQQAPFLAKLPQPAEHAPALLALLRQSKNAENGVRIAPHYPETTDLLVQLALCYEETNLEQGVEAIRRACEKDAAQPLALACHARLAEKAGLAEEAFDALETALAHWPDEPLWHAWSAGIAGELGNLRAAINHYGQCLALDPQNPSYALHLGRLYLQCGQASEAEDMLERACHGDPDHSDVWMLLAEAQRMNGNFESALESTEHATQFDDGSPAPHLLSGEIALQMGKPDRALEHARIALEIAPDDPAAVLFLSKVLTQRGAMAEGLSVIEKSLKNGARSSQPIMLERANLVRRLYGPQAALPLFLDLAQSFPQDAVTLGLLAQAQADCGDTKGAERTAYAAYHLNPELPQLNFLLGRLQHASGQLDQTIHFLSEAIRQSPSDLDPYLDLGQAYLERREHLQALRTYQQAIKVCPRDYKPFYQAAAVLREIKDYAGAEAMLRRAAELAPDDLNIRRQLGAVVALNLVHNSQEANSVL